MAMSGLCLSKEVNTAQVSANSHQVVGVSHVADGLAGHVSVVHHPLRRDLAGQKDHTRVHQRFAGHAAIWVLGEQGVEYAVGDLIGQLVRMPHAYRFTCKQELLVTPGTYLLERDDKLKTPYYKHICFKTIGTGNSKFVDQFSRVLAGRAQKVSCLQGT